MPRRPVKARRGSSWRVSRASVVVVRMAVRTVLLGVSLALAVTLVPGILPGGLLLPGVAPAVLLRDVLLDLHAPRPLPDDGVRADVMVAGGHLKLGQLHDVAVADLEALAPRVTAPVAPGLAVRWTGIAIEADKQDGGRNVQTDHDVRPAKIVEPELEDLLGRSSRGPRQQHDHRVVVHG